MSWARTAARIGVCAAGLILALDVAAETPTRLFCVERSKNANVACYDVRRFRGGGIDLRSPLDAYWIMRAENGRREELTWFERKLAYGYRTVGEGTSAEIRVELMALPGRALTIKRLGKTFRAEAAVAGRPSSLRRVYVHAVEGAPLPKVLYVDLWGTDLETGRVNHERLANR
jgi:hypothetical protein